MDPCEVSHETHLSSSRNGSDKPRHNYETGNPCSSETLDIHNVLQNSIDEIFAGCIHEHGSALNQGINSSPTRGNTTSLGSIKVSLEYGEFLAYAFQLSNNDTMIVLTMGDIQTPDPLKMRLHSECITSETLGGCDCDCVEQLNKALKDISEEGRGALFYLRQEGRGAGFGSKARDRMMVQSSQNQIDTFQAYHKMGLEEDPRTYSAIREVVYLLGITANFIPATNNPNKIRALQELGIQLEEVIPSIVSANPYNANYLESKRALGGHTLDKIDFESVECPLNVIAFSPAKISNALRFTHVASYALAVRPTNGMLLLDTISLIKLKQYERVQEVGLISSTTAIKDNQHLVQLTNNEHLEEAAKSELEALIAKYPYWFSAHVYNDICSGLHYVVLEYGKGANVNPLLRVHSESLFQRFPLASNPNKHSYHQSVREIVRHGKGAIFLYPEDGKGKGFNAAFLEQRLIYEKVAKDEIEAAQILGLAPDLRRYDGIAQLVKHHYPQDKVSIIFRSPDRIKPQLIKELQKLEVQMDAPVFLNGTKN